MKHNTADKRRIEELEYLIKRNQDLYYNGDAEIPDSQFDRYWDELTELDPDNPVLKKVGFDHSDDFEKVKHIIPMGSQNKCNSYATFNAWYNKHMWTEMIVEHKLDGCSIELQYSNGKCVKAVTRGNGYYGDVITSNARKMQGFIPEVSGGFSGATRGEVILMKDVFQSKYFDKANCRNTANGIMKRRNGEGCENLTIICYDAISTCDSVKFNNELDKLRWLTKQGFTTAWYEVFTNPMKVIEFRDKMQVLRENLPYNIDGLVIKDNNLHPEDADLPRPDSQIAFKFELDTAVTTITSVEWSQNGPTYTPVAIYEPVELCGTIVKRANLVNMGTIKSLGVYIGSKIVVSKRGEIIPKIESQIPGGKFLGAIVPPTTCDGCGTKLVVTDTEVRCPNQACIKRAFHRVSKWIQVMDIKGLGITFLKVLFDNGVVEDIHSLYTTVHPSNITKFFITNPKENFSKRAVAICDNIRNHPTELSLARFIAGLDIDGIGETLAQTIVDAGFDTLESIMDASVDSLSSIRGVAVITAQTLLDGLNSLRGETFKILKVGKFKLVPRVENGGKNELVFRDQDVVFTGSFETGNRAEMEHLAQLNGANTKSAVTKKTAYLVTNLIEPTSSKYLNALKFGVKIISEQEFLEMIGM